MPQPEPPRRSPASAYRTDRLRLRHLRLLQLIDRRGSLGSAARELGVSQPAATLLLRELEAVFASTLVARGPRGGRLTAAGALALERLTIALVSVERALEAARAPASEPVLRVGCIQVVGVELLPAALARLEGAAAPGRIRIREGRARDLVAALCAGELDCVIGWMDEAVAQGLPVAQLEIEPLRHGRMQVVAAPAHPLARRRSVPAAELARWRWIVPPPESRTHAAFLRLFLGNGVAAPPVTVECAALHTMLHMVAQSRFLAVAPDGAVRAYARRGMVVALKGPALDLGRDTVSLLTRRDSAALPAVGRFRNALLAKDYRSRTAL
jgi:molybdate transport repressor ModE-like protein